MKKVIFQDWIVDLSHDPSVKKYHDSTDEEIRPNPKIVRAVRKALGKLTDSECELVRMFYYEGENLARIASEFKLDYKEVCKIHSRAIRKLRKHLAAFVSREFGLKTNYNKNCPICNSPYLGEINNLFKLKKKEETWKKIIHSLKTSYKIEIKTPQTLIGHQRYHMLMED
jgi:hypothetical protein